MMDYENEQKNLRKDFELVFQEQSNVVYRLCLYKTSNKDVAHDITQETFMRLWKVLCSGKEVDKPKQYVYQIARNLIVDYYKDKKSVSLDQLQEAGFEPESKAGIVDDAEVSILKEVIESLEPDFREVAYLRFVEEMKVKDIAEMLDLSENLVSVRINRAKNKIKEKFNKK